MARHADRPAPRRPPPGHAAPARLGDRRRLVERPAPPRPGHRRADLPAAVTRARPVGRDPARSGRFQTTERATRQGAASRRRRTTGRRRGRGRRSVSSSQRSPVQTSRARCSRRRATISRSSSPRRKRRRRSSTPEAAAWSRWATTASHSAGDALAGGRDRRARSAPSSRRPGRRGLGRQLEHLLEVAPGLLRRRAGRPC